MVMLRRLLWCIGQIIRVVFFFVVFAIIFYFTLNWFHEEYQGISRYEKPEGGNVMEVFNPNDSSNTPFVSRLMEYYLLGE